MISLLLNPLDGPLWLFAFLATYSWQIPVVGQYSRANRLSVNLCQGIQFNGSLFHGHRLLTPAKGLQKKLENPEGQEEARWVLAVSHSGTISVASLARTSNQHCPSPDDGDGER